MSGGRPNYAGYNFPQGNSSKRYGVAPSNGHESSSRHYNYSQRRYQPTATYNNSPQNNLSYPNGVGPASYRERWPQSYLFGSNYTPSSQYPRRNTVNEQKIRYPRIDVNTKNRDRCWPCSDEKKISPVERSYNRPCDYRTTNPPKGIVTSRRPANAIVNRPYPLSQNRAPIGPRSEEPRLRQNFHSRISREEVEIDSFTEPYSRSLYDHDEPLPSTSAGPSTKGNSLPQVPSCCAKIASPKVSVKKCPKGLEVLLQNEENPSNDCCVDKTKVQPPLRQFSQAPAPVFSSEGSSPTRENVLYLPTDDCCESPISATRLSDGNILLQDFDHIYVRPRMNEEDCCIEQNTPRRPAPALRSEDSSPSQTKKEKTKAQQPFRPIVQAPAPVFSSKGSSPTRENVLYLPTDDCSCSEDSPPRQAKKEKTKAQQPLRPIVQAPAPVFTSKGSSPTRENVLYLPTDDCCESPISVTRLSDGNILLQDFDHIYVRPRMNEEDCCIEQNTPRRPAPALRSEDSSPSQTKKDRFRGPNPFDNDWRARKKPNNYCKTPSVVHAVRMAEEPVQSVEPDEVTLQFKRRKGPLYPLFAMRPERAAAKVKQSQMKAVEADKPCSNRRPVCYNRGSAIPRFHHPKIYTKRPFGTLDLYKNDDQCCFYRRPVFDWQMSERNTLPPSQPTKPGFLDWFWTWYGG